jgi:hypothetical protein
MSFEEVVLSADLSLEILVKGEPVTILNPVIVKPPST